jgi:two-component system chemotaxis response regulator CheY
MIAENNSIRKAYHANLVILVVEDHMLFTKEMKHVLPEHTVVFARSVEDAKLRYDEALPNIIFLDIDLPDGNGFELLDYIRDREPEAYVVMLTGSKIESDVMISQKKGARGYVIKPFTRSKIEKHIAEYLELREKQMQLLLAETTKHRQEELYLSPTMKI